MTRPSILVVDDEAGIRTALVEILREEGWEAEAVASGEDCLKDRKSTRLNSSHIQKSRMPSSA